MWPVTCTWFSTRSEGRRWRGPGVCSSPEESWSPSPLQEEQTTDERIRAAYFIVEPSRPQLLDIARLIQAGALQPVVGAVFPLAEAQQAYEYKPVRGKVVLRVVNDDPSGLTHSS